MCLVNELWDYSPVAATSEAKCDSMRYREDGTNGIHKQSKSRKRDQKNQLGHIDQAMLYLVKYNIFICVLNKLLHIYK